MKTIHGRIAVAFLLLFAILLAVIPPPALAAGTAEQAAGESAADRTTIKAQNVKPETGQTTE